MRSVLFLGGIGVVTGSQLDQRSTIDNPLGGRDEVVVTGVRAVGGG